MPRPAALVATLLVVLVGGTSLYALARRDTDLRPEEQTVHVFPSIVKSDTWHNLQTLGLQELGEDALYQDFTEDNSAFIDPSGALPAEPTVSGYNQDVQGSVEQSASTPAETVSSLLPTVPDDGSQTETASTSDPVTDPSAPDAPGVDASTVQDESGSLETTVSDPDTQDVLQEGASETSTEAPALEEETSVPAEPAEEPAPQDEPDEAPLDPIVSFFKRVTGSFAFTQAATTTVLPAEVVPEPVPEEPGTVVSDDSEPQTDPVVPVEEELPVPDETPATAAPEEVVSEEPKVPEETLSPKPAPVTDIQPEAAAPDDSSATETSGVGEPTQTVADPAWDTAYSITFEDFGVPTLASGQFVNNLQLRLSLGARYELSASSTLPTLEAAYSFGEFSGEAGSIILDEEVSNALNGGYFLLPLPSLTDPSLLSDLSVTLTLSGGIEALDGLFVDAVWLEVGTIVFDSELLRQRYAPGQLSQLRGFKNMEFLGDTLDFTRDQLPEFSMRYNSQRNVAVRAVRNMFGRDLASVRKVTFFHGGTTDLGIRPSVTITPEGLITVLVSEEEKLKMKPGMYRVEFEIDEGGVLYEDSFEFQWGVLAINTNQTEYSKDERVEVSMGALSPGGNTICDANLNLYVTDPRGFISREQVLPSGLCNGNNVIDVPDYSTSFVVDQIGDYTLYLERLDDAGNVISHTYSSLSVVRNQEVAIERVGPTRIYPPATYPMVLTVHTKDTAFSGTIVERVPRDFMVFNTDATVNRYADFTELVWDISLLSSSSKSVSYEFDAPDISPFLYELGPARLVDDKPSGAAPVIEFTASGTASTTVAAVVATDNGLPVVFEELRQWQIASDAVGNMVLLWDGTEGSIPAGWSCISCTGGAFNQQFIIGSSSYNTATGTASHTHTANGSVETTLATATNQDVNGTVVAANTHTHTYTPTISSVNNLPAYRDLLVIQTTSAGEATTIPAGAIAIFDVASSSLPSGWNRYAAQDGYYVRGAGTAGNPLGSNSHSHTITGTTGAAGGTDYRAQGGTTVPGGSASHTHSVSSATTNDTIEPPYIEVVLAKLSADASAPNNLIAMWTEDTPSGWVDVSSDTSSPFSNRLIKASTTYGATGGVAAHAHSNVLDIVSGGASASAQSRSGTLGTPFVHDHLVDVTNFSAAVNTPPSKTIVFGKKQGTDPVYDQYSYWWYANNVSNQTPSDPWPAGGTDLLEGEPITALSTPLKPGDLVRLRMNVAVTNASSTAGTAFKLQYVAADTCSTATGWQRVGNTSSTTAWRGYDNSGVTDHSTLTTLVLATSTVLETYEENGFATSTPNEIGPDGYGEWDYVLQHNDASAGTNYCFRMVEDDDTAFAVYTDYPQLYTNEAPTAPTLTKLFDNEKTASTSPWFYFYATDAEGESVHYQIQVDDDYGFGSTVVDRDTISNSSLFENQVLTSDKAPFDEGALIRFKPSTTLSNGTTYYWRVRGSDPDGSDSWGDWSEIRSFTIDTSLTVSAWFQTTEEQFDTNSLSGLETPSSDHVALISGSTTGSMIGTPIDFDDGTYGSVWGQFLFSESDASSVINYQIQYLNDASAWVLIPDGDLSGNSTGLTTTTSLLNLDTDTYNQIRVVTNFTGSGGSPQVNDWTVEWGYRVETPTISKLFANEKTGTTTPTLEFTTSDPQGGDLTYEVSWSTDYTFTSSTTKSSASDGGFVDITPPISTDPFTSGHTIQYTIQSGDALTNNTTYWWRVRAKTGSNSYSLWTDPTSFTVDTTVTASTWFQTTEEQFDTNVLSGTVAIATDAVSVATTATEAMLVYGEGTVTTPRYRQWNGSAWSSEGSLGDVGAPIRWAVVKAGTTREEYVAATVGTDGDVNAQVFAAGEWGDLFEMTTTMGNVNAQGFDVAYETLSGDAMVAYCDGDANPSYRIWNGSTWSSETPITLGNSNNCEWLSLISDPTSDEIILFSRDTTASTLGSYEAQVWNGSGWANSETLGRIDEEAYAGIAAGYEEGGDALVASADWKNASFLWSAWTGTWSSTDQQTAIEDDFEWGYLASDEGTNSMALCYLDEDTDIGTIVWTGSAWGSFNEHTITGNAKDDAAFSCVYESAGGRDGYIMTAYSDTSATYYDISTNGGSSWAGGTQINSIANSATMELKRTGEGTILGTFFDSNDSLLATEWNGSSWSSTATIEDDMPVNSAPFGRPYSTAPRNPGTQGTVIVSPGIDFTDGVGPYWQEMNWVDSTPGSSDILYFVQYWDGDSWEFIPNGDLSGNESGTNVSPIDLTGLNVSTYDLIRPYAALSCDGASNCPELQDWTIEWAEGITVSGTLDQYDQSTPVNSGTIAVAVNGVLQTGKTGTVAAGVWSINNVTVFSGDIVTVFVSDTPDSSEAVGVTQYDGSGDITGFQLYERHLTLGSDDASAALTSRDVASYNVNNDEDLFIDLSGSTLQVCATTGCADAELFINASTTFTPGGPAATHDIEINGSFVATSTVYVSGSWDNNATVTMTNSSVVFEATSTTESIDSTGALSASFNNVTFGTTTGSATWTLPSSLDVNGDLAVERGTLSRGTTDITVAGDLATGANGFWTGVGTTTFDGSGTSNWSDQNSTLQNVGDVVIDGSSKTVTLAGNVAAESITIGVDDVFSASATGYAVTVYDNWTNNGTFAAQTGTVIFAATTASKQIDPGGDAFYNLTFNGANGDWSFTETAVTVNNDFTVATGTVIMPSATTTIAGSFSAAGGTFAHNNAVIEFTSSGAETITASTTALLNEFFDLVFDGSGSWTILDQDTTVTSDLLVKQGTVTLPSGTLSVGGTLQDLGGAFVHNSGTVDLTSSDPETLTAGGSVFNNLTTTGSGSWTFSDTNVSIAGDLTISSGTLTLPSGVLSLGGSLLNTATLSHNTGQVTFNSTDTGETIDLGGATLYDMIFDSSTGGWTLTADAHSVASTTLTAGTFTASGGTTLTVDGVFTNSMLGASTTWIGSTLSLTGGTYSINTKTDERDTYDTLEIGATAHISMWNSDAVTVTIAPGGSLYAQDYADISGLLYIYGSYTKTGGAEYWSYSTDFDGTDLTGGGERNVAVSFASGATAVLTDVNFEMLGDPTASTTVQNQGSGTYEVTVSGGTTTAQYFEASDLGGNGFSFLDSMIVDTFSDASFTVAANTASALSVSSSTIDANPALQIYRVQFATTTAISAYNVSQTIGTPSSYWWFRDSYGNLYGEQFDNDTGDPGSIRWDNSSLVVTIAGTIYDNDQSTPLNTSTCGVGSPVTVVVEGGSTYTGSCAAGVYSIPGVTIVGDPTLTIYLDNADNGERATAITKTVTADITDLDLYVDHVIVRHEDVSAMTTADMTAFDFADDPDVQFTAATSSPADTLNVFAGNALYVWASSTFTPRGPVTLHADGQANTYDGTLFIGGDATFSGASTTIYTIGGSFNVAAGGSFVSASTTVVMNATTTGKTINAAAGEAITFNELQFTGTGGGWNINGNASTTGDVFVSAGTVTGTGNVTIENGSFYGNGLVSLGGGYVVIENTNTLGGSQGWTFNDLVLGNGTEVGTTTPASTATTTIGGTLTIATAHFLDAGSSVFDLSGTGTVFVENGTFLEDTSTVVYSGTGAANILGTEYYNLTLDATGGSPTYTAIGSGIQVFGDLAVGITGGTTVDFAANDPALNVDGDMTIGASGTFIASDSGSFTLAGSYDNNGTFTSSGGTVVFDGAGVHTIAAGNSTFSGVTINGTGDFTVTEHATATDAWTLTSANDFTVNSGIVLAIGGTFYNAVGGVDTTWTGSILSLYGGGNYEINPSTVSDTYEILAVAANTQIRMWNSDATTYDIDAAGSLYSMDHADTAGDLYIYGAYEKNTGTDFWSYDTDFDGTVLGGSARKVDVYLASGASVLYRDGDLAVIGGAAASTTIQNQGSGAYSFAIGSGASTTWSYYEVRDTDINGLTFSGNPTVHDISLGDFVVSTNNGTAITVGGTAINANPALTFNNNTFNASVGTAYNVTATGTAVSSWRFTLHSGSIDGEGFDVDPDGDPGYVAWDDSAALITVAGHVYQSDGSSVSGVCDDSTQNILLFVQGNPAGTASCASADGSYSIPNVSYTAGNSLIVFINNETADAATVSEDPVSNINNLDLYEDHVIVRHESSDPLSIADMAVYDSSNDGDIPFTAVTGLPDTLNLSSDTKLLVWQNKEFAPDGNVTLSNAGTETYRGDLELQSDATYTANAGEDLAVGGSLISAAGATFDASTGSTTFTSSAAETIDINDGSFYNVQFTGSGSWSITDTVFDINNFNMTAGTLSLPTGTTTVSGYFDNSGGTITSNNSLMVFDGSGAGNTVAFDGSDIGELSFTGSGSWSMDDVNATSTGAVTVSSGSLTLPSGTLSVGGSFRNVGGSITHNTSHLIIATSSAATLLASSSDLYSVTFTGGGALSMEDYSLSLLGDLTIAAGALDLATGTLSIGGSFDAAGGTFESASGTILFNSSDIGETVDPGVSDFYNVSFANPLGGWTITSDATTTNNFALTSAADFTLQSGATLTVEGVFSNHVGGFATDWSGSTLNLVNASEYSINNKSDTGDAYQTLIVGANADISMWKSFATTTTVAPSASLYSMDHASADGALNIYGDYHISTTTAYWSYATDFDGTDLSGGGERAVTVSLAANATTSVDGSALYITGASGNETTITNQGSGTYAFIVSEGTYSAQYYRYRNLNANGLVLSGTPAIPTLNYGDFELAVNGGSLITLSSTTLNANASLIITGARFATTSAITGYNVNLGGTTASAWTFVSHTGNLSGEDFDVDGATACGQVRWDDSACLLTQQTHYRWRNSDGGLNVPDSEWMDVDWNARQRVRVVNNDATTYTDAAIELTVAYDSDMRSDFNDLRFTDSSGTTTIPHFVASSTTGTAAEVWVKVPSLPSNDMASIYMYYNNPTAPSVSSSTQVFIAADDFEDAGITEYSGDTSLFTVDGTFAYGGSYGLDNTSNETDQATDGIARFDQTVSQGEIIRYMQYINTTLGAGSDNEVCTLFGVQSPVTVNQNYGVCLKQYGTDRISLVENAESTDSQGSVTVHDTANVTYSTGWYEVEIDWQTDDTIDVSVYDASGSLTGSVSASDATYTSGGYGFTYWDNHGGWDNFTSRPRVVTEPTVLFGREQGDGGATWAADLDSAATEFTVGDIARLRVAVENTGLSVSDAYRLEFAELGSSPSCEAVDPNDFATVAPSASCGSDPVCMATSPSVANGELTGDLLDGPEIAYTAGRFVEDPSNTTASLTVDQNYYTELEYAVQTNINVSDVNLCFRVSDAGTDLDTYLRVARMNVRFDPSLGPITFNGGDHISLIGGTTTRVYATTTVTDLNGYDDIVNATSTMYRSGAGAACTDDPNNCYISSGAPKCTFTNCAGNSCDLECYADFYYHADPTDTDSDYDGEQWIAMIEVVDKQDGIDIDSSVGVVDVYTLHALAVDDQIDYGALEVYQDTGSNNASTTVQNEGNDAIDIEILGTDLSDGLTSTIPAAEQIFATSSFNYSACTYCTNLDTVATTYELDLSKPTSSSTPITDKIFWGIYVPFGTKSNPHTGVNTFMAIDDNI